MYVWVSEETVGGISETIFGRIAEGNPWSHSCRRKCLWRNIWRNPRCIPSRFSEKKNRKEPLEQFSNFKRLYERDPWVISDVWKNRYRIFWTNSWKSLIKSLRESLKKALEKFLKEFLIFWIWYGWRFLKNLCNNFCSNSWQTF